MDIGSLETALSNGMLLWTLAIALPVLFTFWFMVAVVTRLKNIDNSLRDIGELVGGIESKVVADAGQDDPAEPVASTSSTDVDSPKSDRRSDSAETSD